LRGGDVPVVASLLGDPDPVPAAAGVGTRVPSERDCAPHIGGVFTERDELHGRVLLGGGPVGVL